MLQNDIDIFDMDFQGMDNADPFYRLALAVLIQALTDLKSSDRFVVQKARWWLELDGLIWWELVGFQPSVLRNWLKVITV
jgi:hypothetical protein